MVEKEVTPTRRYVCGLRLCRIESGAILLDETSRGPRLCLHLQVNLGGITVEKQVTPIHRCVFNLALDEWNGHFS